MTTTGEDHAMPDAPAGVTSETHSQVKDENQRLREQLALLKARTETYDAQKREAISNMKTEVNEFVTNLVEDAEFAPYKHEMAPLCRWAKEIDTTDSIDTNLSIGRMISCASAKFKRTREEASQNGEKAQLLADAMKELESLKAERETKMSRITELEGLVDERTTAATKLQEELARHGLMQDKIDFSQRSARENVSSPSGTLSTSASNASGKRPMAAAAAPKANMHDALFGFLTAGNQSGRMITPSATGHHMLGASSPPDASIAAASMPF